MKMYIDLYDLKVGDIFIDSDLPNQRFKALRWKKKPNPSGDAYDMLEAEALVGVNKGKLYDFFYNKELGGSYLLNLYKVMD